MRQSVFAVKTRPLEISSASLPRYRCVTDVLRHYDGDDAAYLLYPQKIRRAARTFLDGFPGRVMYAVKANPHPFVIETLWQAGLRDFDVASLREVEFIAANYPAARMFLMHPVKSRALIARAYQLGVRDFAVDCLDEMQKILDMTGDAPDLNLHLRLALPKPALDEADAVMPLTGKFGADYDTALAILPRARQHAKKLGLCFHVGSQCLAPDNYDRAIGYARQLVQRAGTVIDSLDVGGGFPVAYPDMPIRPMDDYFCAIKASIKAHGFDGVAVYGEPGRALCAEGGSTLARIELRKGQDLYLNDGAYGSLFDAANCAWKYPVRLHRNRPPAPMDKHDNFRFFGPTCDSLDVMNGPFILPADSNEGDWVEIEHLGAYGQALSTRFNGFYSETTFIIDDINA